MGAIVDVDDCDVNWEIFYTLRGPKHYSTLVAMSGPKLMVSVWNTRLQGEITDWKAGREHLQNDPEGSNSPRKKVRRTQQEKQQRDSGDNEGDLNTHSWNTLKQINKLINNI